MPAHAADVLPAARATCVIGVALVVALGLVAGILPALQAMRLRIADALRRMADMAGLPINWLSPNRSPSTLFNLRTIPERKGARRRRRGRHRGRGRGARRRALHRRGLPRAP